ARDSSTSLGMTKPCAIARSAFDDYLFRREASGGLDFSGGLCLARVVCRRLQQLDPRAEQADAPRWPLFWFALLENPSPIFGALRVRQIFHSSFAGLA